MGFVAYGGCRLWGLMLLGFFLGVGFIWGLSLLGFVAYGACRLWGLLLVGFAAYVSCHFWGFLLMWVVFCGGLFHLGVVACGFCCVCGL